MTNPPPSREGGDDKVPLAAPEPHHSSSNPSMTAAANRWETLGANWGAFVTRYPWRILLAALLLAILTTVGMHRLSFTDDYRIYFGPDNPELQAFNTLERTYSKTYNALFVLAPRNGDMFSRDALAAMENLTRAAWKVPYSSRVDSLTNFQHTRGGQDDLVVEDLVEHADKLTPEARYRIKAIALSEPLLVNRLVSKTGHVGGVNVGLHLPGLSPEESHVVAEYCNRLAAQIEREFPGIEVHLSGVVMQDNAFYEATIKDLSTLVPAMYLFVIVVTGLLLRSITGTLATTAVIAAASAAAMGIAGWMGIALSTPSAVAPTIILTVTVGDSIHILSAFFQAMRAGRSKTEAMRLSMRNNLQPVFLTTLTNAIGFLSMNFSDTPPFHDLGNIVAIGVGAAFVFSMTLLPALMMILPVRVRVSTASHAGSKMTRWSDWVIRHRRRILLLSGMTVPAVLAGMLLIEFDDNYIEYFDHSYHFRNEADFVNDNLTGMDSIEYSIPSQGPGGINDPAYLKKIEQFANWYRRQDGVVHVAVLTDITKRLNANLHSNDPSYYRIPEDRELAAQYQLLYELSLPRGFDLNNIVNLDKSASRMTVTLGNLSNARLLALERSAQVWLRENVPDLQTPGASPSIMFAHISERNINSMFTGNILSLLMVSAILLIALRNVKLGLLSLIPNIIPALLAFGIWGYVVGEAGLAIAVVFSMTQGIVVDDSVHFLTYYRAAWLKGATSIQAIGATFRHVGPSMITTSIILVGGFLVLAQSGFAVNSDMGLLTATTFVIALAADMLLLAPLLLLIEDKHRRPRASVTHPTETAA